MELASVMRFVTQEKGEKMTVAKESRPIRIGLKNYEYLENLTNLGASKNLALIIDLIQGSQEIRSSITSALLSRLDYMAVHHDHIDFFSRYKIVPINSPTIKREKKIEVKPKQSGLDERTMQLIRLDYESYCDQCNEESRQPMTFDQWHTWMNE